MFMCLHCGKEKKSSHSSTNKYCSNVCQQDYEYKQRIRKWKETGDIGVSTLKKYLSDVKNNCWICNISEWNCKPLILELEHKDGDSTNNNENNVCLICPNCHSQTDTYKNKNKGSGRRKRMLRYYEGKSF